MLSIDKIEKISYLVIKIIYERFENLSYDTTENRNAPFHKAFLNIFSDNIYGNITDVPFFMSMSSWTHGLNTALKQTYYENVAHILSDGYKREYTGKNNNLLLSKTQQLSITKIITDLNNNQKEPNLNRENELLFENNSDKDELVKAMDFSADVFIEDDDEITAIELKNIRPNSYEIPEEKLKILQGKAALSNEFTDKKINFNIGFPFDPTNAEAETGYDKQRFINSNINMNKYFAEEEVLLASELWDFLSGEVNTMGKLLDIINSIATSEFKNIYEYLNNNRNRDKSLYADCLIKWNLQKELNLINNDSYIKSAIKNNNSLSRIYCQSIFKNGQYNIHRYNTLEKLL
jgi:hypothetical protein